MPNSPRFPVFGDPAKISWADLISACAQDRENTVLWAEFLRRYGCKIRYFVLAACRVSTGAAAPIAEIASQLGGMQESDLVQSAVVRLVEHDCAAMRSFSGTTEDQWLVYLAVISRSVVREARRRQQALKRPGTADSWTPPIHAPDRIPADRERSEHLSVERKLLAREVHSLCERAINGMAGESAGRDMLIFRLYFDHDLSASQIARCQGVNLTKGGVENVINRLKDRIRGVVSAGAPEAVSR